MVRNTRETVLSLDDVNDYLALDPYTRAAEIAATIGYTLSTITYRIYGRLNRFESY